MTKVYIVEEYNIDYDDSFIRRVCKREEVALAFIEKFRHQDNSGAGLHGQVNNYYRVLEFTLVE